jgi:small subunit ribosomal protein S19e
MKDSSPQKVIQVLTIELRKEESIKPPDWSRFVKTGASAERPPIQQDWWFLRSAAVLRRIYLDGPVGTQRLRSYFGGKRRRGHKPAHHRRAGGKIIRLILQQLEKAGYIQKVEKPKRGRVVTPRGQRLIDKAMRMAK